MDNWVIWEILVMQKLQEQHMHRHVPIEQVKPCQPRLRQRLAALLVAAGVRLDAEAGRAVLSPVENNT